MTDHPDERATVSGATPVATPVGEASTGELVSRLTEQASHLIRDELRLAQLEIQQKAKKVGVGAGLFGGAGVVALYGVGALVACAVLGLATVLPAWLSALIVGVLLLIVAGVLALLGKKQVAQGTPPMPQEAVDGLKRDVETVKERAHR